MALQHCIGCVVTKPHCLNREIPDGTFSNKTVEPKSADRLPHLFVKRKMKRFMDFELQVDFFLPFCCHLITKFLYFILEFGVSTFWLFSSMASNGFHLPNAHKIHGSQADSGPSNDVPLVHKPGNPISLLPHPASAPWPSGKVRVPYGSLFMTYQPMAKLVVSICPYSVLKREIEETHRGY